MEIKLQIPPIFTAMATPAERMVVITADTGPVELTDDSDYGGWTIFIYIHPVLALRYFGDASEDADYQYDAVFVTDYGHLENTHDVHDRRDFVIMHCPWPRKEDKKRLEKHAEKLRDRHRDYIMELVARGERAFHSASDDDLPRRRTPYDLGETNGHG